MSNSKENITEGRALQSSLPMDALPTENQTIQSDPEKKVLEKNPEEEPDAFFRGVINRITFRNQETGFGIVRATPEGNEAAINFTPGGSTVVGLLPGTIAQGAHIIARGEWQTHPKFGKQFRAWSIVETEPSGKEAILRYLSSGAVKGFGPVLASRIVEKFGDESLVVIDTDPRRLLEVPGVGEKKLDEILAAWQLKRNLREVLLFFQGHGVSHNLANRIYNTYGDRSIEIVTKNPYVLARDVHGIGFQTADTIAMALKVEPTSIARLSAGIAHTLRKASDEGHCFLPQDLLLSKSASLLGIDNEEQLVSALVTSGTDGEIIIEGEKIYLPLLAEAEKAVSGFIAERIAHLHEPSVPISPSLASAMVTNPPPLPGQLDIFELSPEQQEAVHLAASGTLLVVTGGPGCGKTTVVRTISSLFRRAGLRVHLAAPTGRAAQRLAEVCEMKASTIHRLLKFDPSSRGFVHNTEDQLPIDALIVDESSMIDIQLAGSLLAALPPAARLIIVGDADQLPSVGPGLFLADMLSIPTIPRVRLNRLFRRKDESSITEIAHLINTAVVPDIPAPDGVTKTDAYFLRADTPAEAATLVERLVVDQIPKRFGLRGSDIMVLTPMNQGELGILALNEKLQSQLAPHREGMPSVKVGMLEFRLGDRVCQRVNNYNLGSNGVFNGDQGEIIGIDVEAKSLIIRLWDGREVTYASDILWQLDLAYALTIHRSQGSEVPAVVLVLHESHSILLERQLIYTAVTRAKKLLIIVGTKKALAVATKRSRSKRRFTALAERTLGHQIEGIYVEPLAAEDEHL